MIDSATEKGITMPYHCSHNVLWMFAFSCLSRPICKQTNKKHICS